MSLKALKTMNCSFQITLISDLITVTNRPLILLFRVFFFSYQISVKGESNFNFRYNLS